VFHCDECDFAYDLDQAPGAADAIVAGAAEMAMTLTERSVQDLVRRRQPNLWSPLEYGCHLRDVVIVQRERVLLARRVDRPAPDPMGRDERVDHDGYAEQDPAVVALQLTEATRLFVNVLGRLAPADWYRTIVYTFPDPAERTLRWVAVHTEHEFRHHLLDVSRQLA